MAKSDTKTPIIVGSLVVVAVAIGATFFVKKGGMESDGTYTCACLPTLLLYLGARLLLNSVETIPPSCRSSSGNPCVLPLSDLSLYRTARYLYSKGGKSESLLCATPTACIYTWHISSNVFLSHCHSL